MYFQVSGSTDTNDQFMPPGVLEDKTVIVYIFKQYVEPFFIGLLFNMESLTTHSWIIPSYA